MISLESKLCPFSGNLCAGKVCMWYDEGKKKCAICLLVENKYTPKKKNSTEPKLPAT